MHTVGNFCLKVIVSGFLKHHVSCCTWLPEPFWPSGGVGFLRQLIARMVGSRIVCSDTCFDQGWRFRLLYAKLFIEVNHAIRGRNSIRIKYEAFYFYISDLLPGEHGTLNKL
jgi:hypothetical protein